MSTQLFAADQDYLVDLVQNRTGLVLNRHQIDELHRLVAEAMNDHNLGELKQFLAVFPFTHPLWQGFIQHLTIGETYFFRNASHFNALRHDVLIPLIDRRRRQGFRQLRVWSAGCSTGEEPYSVAMLLKELLPDIEQWAITLLATDLNSDFLDHARAGLYGKRSFRGETPEWIQPRWFRLESGKYRIDPLIRDMVMFRMLNLVSDEYPSAESFTANMDVILCRNVTIYFNPTTTRSVVTRFHRALNTDGWLIVGHSEPNSELYRDFDNRNLRNTVVYQKRELPPPSRELPQKKATVKPAKPLPIPKKTPVHVPVPVDKMELWEAARQAADGERWQDALRLLDDAAQNDVLQAQVHYLRGVIYTQMGDSDAAIKALRRSIYCDTDFALAHFSLGELYAKQQMHKEAARHFKQAKRAIVGLPDGYSFPYDKDLTVEMLNGLLAYHIDRLPAAIKERVNGLV